MASSVRLVIDVPTGQSAEDHTRTSQTPRRPSQPSLQGMCSPTAFAMRQGSLRRLSDAQSRLSNLLSSKEEDRFGPHAPWCSPRAARSPVVTGEAAGVRSVGQAGVIFTLTNTLVGAGALGVPFVFPLAGVGLSIGICFLVVSAMLIVGLCLVESLKKVSALSPFEGGTGNEEEDFGLLGEVAFGPSGRRLINALFAVELWLALVSFFVFIGSNTTFCLGGLGVSTHAWVPIACSGALSFLLLYSPASILAYLSLVSVAFMVMLLAVLVSAGTSMPAKAYDADRLVYADLGGGLQAIGVFLFCFAGAPCIPSIYATAQHPARFPSALAVSFVAGALYYSACGALAYAFYGPTLGPSFTSNLGHDLHGNALPGSSTKVLPMLAALGIIVKLQATLPIIVVPVLSAIGHTGPVARVVFIAVTCGAAVGAREYLDAVMSCTGLVATMSTSILFPVAVYLRLNRPGPLAKLGLASLLVLGSLVAVAGTAQQILQRVRGRA